MVFKKDLIKLTKKNYKIHTIREDVKKLKYVETTKMYKMLKVHLNYKYKKITFLEYNFRFTDCLIAWLRELKSLMEWNTVPCLPQSIPFDTWKSEI